MRYEVAYMLGEELKVVEAWDVDGAVNEVLAGTLAGGRAFHVLRFADPDNVTDDIMARVRDAANAMLGCEVGA